MTLKKEREECWNAKDAFWKCLDVNNENSDKCAKFREEYEKFCSNQWVKHFDRKRKYEHFKAEADKIGWQMPPRNG